ncbi:Protein of unknown function D, partial [Prunus dulcis]
DRLYIRVQPAFPQKYHTTLIPHFGCRRVRDFIHSALYDPKHGYFSQRSKSVGVLPRAIKFNQLEGRKGYMKYLDKIYKESEVSWFTPVEIFKPWYAHGIAEAIMRTANLSVPLKIYEIGGGSGTCAKGIMDYIMLNAPPRVYNNMTYISVEVSPSLAEIQRETVGEVRSHLSKFRVECRDATDRSGWGDAEQQPCWVIMLEVLDNLPHDLIYSENQVSPWMEVWVEKQQDRETLSELYKPLQDSLIKQCVEIIDLDKKHDSQNSAILKAKSVWSKVFPKPQRCWLPTGCLKDGSSSDYSSYLDARGDADIFFPTEFWLLERIDHYCSGWLKLQKDLSSKEGKKRRTITGNEVALHISMFNVEKVHVVA